MVIKICIGNECHIEGSKEVFQILEKLVIVNNIEHEVELNGTFCIGNCGNGVCVKLDEEVYALNVDNAEQFFENEIIHRLNELV